MEKSGLRLLVIEMFRGVSHITMDAKGRLALPSRQRERLHALCEGSVVVTIDTHSKCLRLYPMPVWEELEQALQSLPSMQPGVKSMQRLILGYASELELDGSGRVLLPQPLRDHACLEKKLVLVGMGSKFEIWSEDNWLTEREMNMEAVQQLEDLPEELTSIAF